MDIIVKNIPKEELAWMAGFFDGEGCITISYFEKNDGSIQFSRKVGVTNTKIESLKVFQKYFGGKIYKRIGQQNKLLNAKLCYEWALFKESAYFLGQIIPYLKIKKCQADLYMDYEYWLSNFPVFDRGHNKNKNTEGAIQSMKSRKYIVDVMHKLNKRGINGNNCKTLV